MLEQNGLCFLPVLFSSSLQKDYHPVLAAMEGETNNNGGIEKWRRFFQGAGADIFSVIQYAIAVAALDCPTEFRRRRDEIAQRLYRPVFCKCMKCDSMTLHKPVTDCSRKPLHPKSVQQSNDGKAFHQEVRRIKAILDDPDESDSQVFQSLRKLEQMQLTFEILKETQIGRSANALRKARKSASIRALVKRLNEEWKNVVDEWVDAAGKVAGAAGNTSEPAQPLPSPPSDKGAFITNHSTPKEIAKKSGSGDYFKDKMVASKRKLQEGYRQAEEAKKKRTVQVLALEDISKPNSRSNYGRPRFQHPRPWGNHHRR